MKKSRLWTGLASTMAFMLVLSLLGMDCMMSYEGTVNGALGISTSKVVNEGGSTENTTYYESEYGELNAENLQKLIADTYSESVAEEEEGAVLLKNANNALPLSSNETKVTLFGHATAQPLYKNSSAGSSGYKGEYCISLYDALSNAGFQINDTLYDSYTNSVTTRGNGSSTFGQEATVWNMGEEEITFYTNEIQNSWADNYNDVAIVMLSREGGEGVEVYTKDPDEGISQLALHQDEKDMLQMIKDSGAFEKTIVLINSGNAMEVDWLDQYDIDACLWIGLPGQRGFDGVANLLTGDVNPSGHLTDTYAVDSLSAPSVVNGSYNNQNWTNLDDVLADSDEIDSDISWYTVQAESIYIGYKYYETRYEDTILNQGNAASTVGSATGSSWNYTDEVSYPFGYGLSYTSFEQTLDKVEIDGDNITVTVTVTNTGDVAGKSTVQIYAQTPYGDYEKENMVEKSAIQLLDFAKTEMLEPGTSQTITITCDKYLFASYDYIKAMGYVMIEGNYYLTIGTDAHDALNNVLAAKGATGMVGVSGEPATGNLNNVYNWEEAFDNQTYRASQYTDEEVTNQFTDCDINYWISDSVTYLSRNDWEGTYPVSATQVELTDEMMDVLNGDYYEQSADAQSLSNYTLGDNQNIPLATLIGLDYDDPEWDTYLNQFTLEELATIPADNFGTAEITSVGKPAILAGDGPDGVGGTFNKEKYGDDRDDCCFPCENILAATFNKDLLTRRGELMGEEALYLEMAYVWMPGTNLHRTPFGGRNFEYYSEDANMNYLCEIVEVQGVEKKGIAVGAKHLAANDQENNREGISVFFNEQAFREGALRGCEGSLTTGGGMAVMHAFNRLGLKWSSASTALCTQVVRNEWGFMGIEETDAIAGDHTYKSHFLSTMAAGTNVYCLDFASASTSTLVAHISSNDDGYMLGLLRDTAHYYLYTIANSAVMNGYNTDSIVVSVTPWWQPVMYSLITLFTVLEILFIVLLVRGRKKENIIVEEAE